MQSSVIIGLVVTAILIILGFLYPKSKKLYVLDIIWMIILLCFNDGGVDYNVHTGIYNTASLDVSFFNSPLYILICYWFKCNDISFYIMNFILNLVCVYILHYIIKKNTTYISLACSFLLIYPLIENIIQKRFFLAACIAVLGFSIMIRKEPRYRIKSLILILIGGLIHQAVFVFLVLYVLQLIDFKKVKKLLFYFIIIGYGSIPFIPRIAALIFPGGKVNLYFYTLKIDLFDAICWMILHAIFVIIISLLYKKIPSNNKDIDTEIYKLNLVSLVLLPLYYYEPTFIRLYRSMLIINYIFVANKFIKIEGYNNLIKNQLLLVGGWTLYIVMVYCMIYVFTGAGFERLVSPEFINNIVLRLIAGG